jgi:hypothetical protein
MTTTNTDTISFSTLSHISERTLKKMEKVLENFNIPLKVMWVPDETKTKHGEIKDGTIDLRRNLVVDGERW